MKEVSELDNELVFEPVAAAGVQGLQVVPAAVEVAKRGPGRPPLPVEERLRRRAEQKVRYRARAEAKRRAAAILQERHADEFRGLVDSLLAGLPVS